MIFMDSEQKEIGSYRKPASKNTTTALTKVKNLGKLEETDWAD